VCKNPALWKRNIHKAEWGTTSRVHTTAVLSPARLKNLINSKHWVEYFEGYYLNYGAKLVLHLISSSLVLS
jgi:hypothetical protein